MAAARWKLATFGVLLLATAVAGCVASGNYFAGTALTLLRWPIGTLALALTVVALRRGQRRAAAVTALTVVVLGGQLVAQRYARQSLQPLPDPARELQVFNYNLLYEGGRDEQTLKTAASADADVLTFQEVSPRWEQRLDSALSARYPHKAVSPRRGVFAVAIYSRYPLAARTHLPGSGLRAFAQCAEVQVPQRPVYLCSVHLDSPARALLAPNVRARALAQNAYVRKEQWEALHGHLAANATSARKVIAGDFNTMDLEPLHERISRDFVDVAEFLSVKPDRTWPHYNARGLPAFVRIDYVWVQGPLRPVAARALAAGGSDHRPVLARIAL